MRRPVRGLSQADGCGSPVPDGIYQLRIEAASLQPHRTRPLLRLRFQVLAPPSWAGDMIDADLLVTQRELWKLHWFLRDFGYDADLLAHDEIDDRQMIGLRGTARVVQAVRAGCCRAALVGFAPASMRETLEHKGGAA